MKCNSVYKNYLLIYKLDPFTRNQRICLFFEKDKDNILVDKVIGVLLEDIFIGKGYFKDKDKDYLVI